MEQEEQLIKKVNALVDAAKGLMNKPMRVAVMVHFNPDGDAMGAALGLKIFLEKLGHQATVFAPNAFPAFLRWLPGSKDVKVYQDGDTKLLELLKSHELIFGVDFNEISRMDKFAETVLEMPVPRLLIDHHPGPDYAAFNQVLSCTNTSSASELTFEFMQAYDASLLDAELGQCIFSGLLTDTGSFSYNASNPRTHENVAKLLRLGVDKERVHDNLFNNNSVSRIKLLGHCLGQKLVVLPQYHTAFISLSKQEKDSYNFQKGDSEGFVNYPLSLKGIIFSVFFNEDTDRVKISFRSKGSFPANLFSRNHFEGGGHLNAAGGFSRQSMTEVLQKFQELLPGYADMLKAGYSETQSTQTV